MASDEQLEGAIAGLAARLNEAEIEPGVIPDRTLLCVLPDKSYAYRAELSDGMLQDLSQAQPSDEADVRLTAKSDDLLALIEGRLNVAVAFLLGRVRVDASPADLMLLRKLF